MLIEIVRLLRRRRDYTLLTLAFLLSGIGTAFTLVAVYAELERIHAGPYYYGAAFICGLLPGLFSSGLGPVWAKRFSIAKLILFGELIGALALVFPIVGARFHAPVLLLGIEVVGSFVAGLLFPLLEIFTRSTFSDEELPTVSVVSSYVFSAQFVLGQFLGTLVYPIFGTTIFFSFDFVTYVVSAGLIWIAWRKTPENFNYESDEKEGRSPSFIEIWRGLDLTQKRAFLVSPFLAAVCAPSMSLLPIAGERFGGEAFGAFHRFSPVLVILLAKTIGQMLGPVVFRHSEKGRSRFDSLLSDTMTIPILLGVYLLFYGLVFRTDSFSVALFSTVLAHTFSNIVFIVATYALNRHFSPERIGLVAGWHYRITIGLMSISSLWAGAVQTRFGYGAVSLMSWGILIVLPVLLWKNESATKRRKALV